MKLVVHRGGTTFDEVLLAHEGDVVRRLKWGTQGSMAETEDETSRTLVWHLDEEVVADELILDW